MDKLLSITQVAEILSIHRQTAYNWVAIDKKIKGVKIGRHWKIKESDLKDFIDGK